MIGDQASGVDVARLPTVREEVVERFRGRPHDLAEVRRCSFEVYLERAKHRNAAVASRELAAVAAGLDLAVESLLHVGDDWDDIDGRAGSRSPMETTITTDDGAELWVRDTGPPAAPVVLCCHGGPGIADYLEPVEATLGDDVRTIRWDQRGSGRSSASGPFTIERFVADVDAVRAAAGVERVVLFGHSWGANLAALYGQHRPARLDALIYVSGVGLSFWPDFSAEHKRRQEERLGPENGSRLAELRTLDRSPAEETELRMLYIRSELHDVEDVATATRLLDIEQRYPTNLVANAALNEACKQLTVAEQVDRLGAIDCPVLVIHGASDPRPTTALETLVSALQNVTLLEFADAGHNPWVDQPERFAAEVRSFLTTVS